MSKPLVAAGMMAIGVAGAALWLQYQDNRALRREISLLREEVQLATAARSVEQKRVDVPVPASTSEPGTAALAGDEEVAKWRREMAALRTSMQELTKLAQAAQAAAVLKNLSQGDKSVASKIIPVAQMKNAGKATPEAATETVLWAAAGGDVDTLANSLVFTDSARGKADAWFATLSENVRQQYGSPEKVIALMIARDAAALTGMQVLGKKEVTPEDVGLRVRFESDGKTKDDTFVMHRTGDGWRMLLADQTVETFAKKISGKK